MSDRLKILAIVLIAAAVYLVGNSRVQLVDRDEPRYAQCSRQMLQSGDWVVPRLYDKIRAAKPPGIYWCQAAAMTLFGDNSFAARVPSSLAAVLTAILLSVVVWRAAGARHAVWAVFVFSTSALTIVAAKVCLTDSVLLLWETTGLACIYLLWRGRGGWPAVVGLAVSIAFGGLVKGPFILGVLVGTLVMLGILRGFDWWRDRRLGRPTGGSLGFDPAGAEPWQTPLKAGPIETGTAVLAHPSPSGLQLRPSAALAAVRCLVGLLLVIAIVAPWIILVHHREPSFLMASTKDAMEHLESGSEGHVGPPGYHLALIWITFMPWCLILPLTIGLAIRNRSVPEIRFALAAVLGTWVFVEVLQTKLPHYMLACFPALAFLTADAIIRCLRGEIRDLESRAFRIGVAIWGIAIAGILTAPWWILAFKFRDFPWVALICLSIFGAAFGLVVYSLFATQRTVAALVSLGIGSWIGATLFFGLYLPNANPLRASIRVAQVLKQHDIVYPHQVLMLDYKEPSLAFYQGGTIREAKHSLALLDQHFDSAPPWMVMTNDIWNQTTPDVRARLDVVASFPALNYSDSLRRMEVMVVRKK